MKKGKGRERNGKGKYVLFVILVIWKKVEIQKKRECIYFVWFLERKEGFVLY